MSPLRQPLKRPETYLALLALLVMLVVLDSYRPPRHQVCARMYVSAVHGYQVLGRPLLKGHIQCRYRPTCSEYSIAAVEDYGIRKGLVLTVERINACTAKVPMGTFDPVAPARAREISTR